MELQRIQVTSLRLYSYYKAGLWNFGTLFPVTIQQFYLLISVTSSCITKWEKIRLSTHTCRSRKRIIHNVHTYWQYDVKSSTDFHHGNPFFNDMELVRHLGLKKMVQKRVLKICSSHYYHSASTGLRISQEILTILNENTVLEYKEQGVWYHTTRQIAGKQLPLSEREEPPSDTHSNEVSALWADRKPPLESSFPAMLSGMGMNWVNPEVDDKLPSSVNSSHALIYAQNKDFFLHRGVWVKKIDIHIHRDS